MSLGMEDFFDDEMTAVANTLDKDSTQFIDALRKKNILFRDKLIYTAGLFLSPPPILFLIVQAW
jgi:hypothetical protein